MNDLLPVRVMVLDTWDALEFGLPPETAIGDLKRRALEATRIRRPAEEYQVKYLGAELHDEAATLASAGVAANGALIVLPRRRRPAR
jgi:hypothetical protein